MASTVIYWIAHSQRADVQDFTIKIANKSVLDFSIYINLWWRISIQFVVKDDVTGECGFQ